MHLLSGNGIQQIDEVDVVVCLGEGVGEAAEDKLQKHNAEGPYVTLCVCVCACVCVCVCVGCLIYTFQTPRDCSISCTAFCC